jgi:hypothetical protein
LRDDRGYFARASEKQVSGQPDARRDGSEGTKAMSQTMSVTEAVYSRARPAPSIRKRRVRANRRARRPQPVPALNWPSDLFADNATMGELVAEDFPLPAQIAIALFGQPEIHSHTSH